MLPPGIDQLGKSRFPGPVSDYTDYRTILPPSTDKKGGSAFYRWHPGKTRRRVASHKAAVDRLPGARDTRGVLVPGVTLNWRWLDPLRPLCPRQAPRVHRDAPRSTRRVCRVRGRSYGLSSGAQSHKSTSGLSLLWLDPPTTPPTRLLLGGDRTSLHVTTFHRCGSTPYHLLALTRGVTLVSVVSVSALDLERGRSIKCRPVRWDQGNMIQAYLAGDVCHGAYRAVE